MPAKKRKPSKSPKQLSVERLTIVSGDGNPRMVLGTDSPNGMPIIRFMDDNSTRLEVGLASDGFPHISMSLANQNCVLNLQAADNGNITINLSYPNGNPALWIIVRPQGDIEIKTFDRDGKQIV